MRSTSIEPELKHEVSQLLDAYVQCIDDDDLERWPDFFTENCLYKVIPRIRI
jgi:anthranilate 1,2-dioxygenase small subunit